MSTTSQFIRYTSGDFTGPGPIFGTIGSLIQVLDACLVNGYSGHPSAGWTKPLANITASTNGAPALACYKQASGSGMTLFVNDSGPSPQGASVKEAWACGFEQIASLTGSVGEGTIYTGSYGIAAGFGQFPLPTQLLTTGHVVIAKSGDATTARPWQLFADASTCYLFIQSGSPANSYNVFVFSDIYSFYGPADAYRCFIAGRNAENTNGAQNGVEQMDLLPCPNTVTAPIQTFPWVNSRFLVRNFGNIPGSIPLTIIGDNAMQFASSVGSFASPIAGVLSTPNAVDNSYYLAPLRMVEYTVPTVRGRLRGLYHVCHPVSSFGDGQIFNGSGDFAGKSFMIIKPGIWNGFWAIEMSNTVETN